MEPRDIEDCPTIGRLETAVTDTLRALGAAKAACAFTWRDRAYPLYPFEAASVAAAVTSRRAEFSAGRHAARRALELLGAPAAEIPMGALGEPVWPSGFGGSICHDGRFAGALAHMPDETAQSLSLDLIDRSDLAPYAAAMEHLRAPGEPDRTGGSEREAARVFGAKEAAVKIASPALNRLIDPTRIEAIASTNGFAVRILGSALLVDVRIVEIDRAIVAIGLRRPDRRVG